MSADLLKRLAEAGTPMELIMEVAETLADAKAAQRLLDRRREKDRERKRNSAESVENAESVESAESSETPSPLTTPPKKPPHPKNTPPLISPQPQTNGRARASRLPVDWQPDELKGKAAQMVARWQPGEVERELAKFRNYWMGKAGKDACKLDWQRTWINWLISADERKPRNGNGTGDIGKSAAAFAALGEQSGYF